MILTVSRVCHNNLCSDAVRVIFFAGPSCPTARPALVPMPSSNEAQFYSVPGTFVCISGLDRGRKPIARVWWLHPWPIREKQCTGTVVVVVLCATCRAGKYGTVVVLNKQAQYCVTCCFFGATSDDSATDGGVLAKEGCNIGQGQNTTVVTLSPITTPGYTLLSYFAARCEEEDIQSGSHKSR